MGERSHADDQPASNGGGRPHRPTGESLEQALRILRRNRQLLEGTVIASLEGEEEAGGGHTVSSDPANGVTRGDFSND